VSAAAVEGNAVDPAADSGAAATVQARAVVIGAITAIVVQPLALLAWWGAILAWSIIANGRWEVLTVDWQLSLRELWQLGAVSLAVMGVATPFVVVLGVPAFLVLKHFGRVNCLNLLLAGALAGALPFALMANGLWQVAAIAGLHGTMGALAFYSAWRRAGGIPRLGATAD
jgi:hypothetical protein